MRRIDREITDKNEIEEIILKADSCRIAFIDGNVPYIVALNFGYEKGNPQLFYFHSAPEGKKIDLIKKNPLVCFQMDIDHELIEGKTACQWGMKYRSVTGTGILSIIENIENKKKGLISIMRHYSFQNSFDFSEELLQKTLVLQLKVQKITAKKNGN